MDAQDGFWDAKTALVSRAPSAYSAAFTPSVGLIVVCANAKAPAFLRGLVNQLRIFWLRGQATAAIYRAGLNMSKPPRLDRRGLCRERWLRELATAVTYRS